MEGARVVISKSTIAPASGILRSAIKSEKEGCYKKISNDQARVILPRKKKTK